MKCLMFCVDALDCKLIKEFGTFKDLGGIKTLVHSQASDNHRVPSSPEMWACIYTGCTEIDLKNKGFKKTRYKNDIKVANTISNVDKKSIWNTISELGYSVGVLEGLITDLESFPKKDGNFLITGIDNPRKCYPDNLDKMIPLDRTSNALPYPVSYKLLVGKDVAWKDLSAKDVEENMEDYYFGMSEFVKIRNSYLIPSIKYLNNKYDPDFLMTFRYEIDHLCHMQWHEKSKKTIQRGYEYIEEYVYRLIDMLKPDNVIIISDHGMGDLNKTYKDSKTINGKPIGVAVAGQGVVVSCEHQGAGFLLISGKDFEAKKEKIYNNDIYDLIVGLYKSQ